MACKFSHLSALHFQFELQLPCRHLSLLPRFAPTKREDQYLKSISCDMCVLEVSSAQQILYGRVYAMDVDVSWNRYQYTDTRRIFILTTASATLRQSILSASARPLHMYSACVFATGMMPVSRPRLALGTSKQLSVSI